MKKVLMLCCALSLGGCVSRAIAERDCRSHMPPKPDQIADSFGLLGAAIAQSDPSRVSWDRDLDACINQKLSDHPDLTNEDQVATH